MTPFSLPRFLALAAGGACCALALGAPAAVHAADAPKYQFPAPSSHSVLEQKLGLTTITVDYSRPNKSGREIFGKLVPYNTVWRTGANSSTKLSFDSQVGFAGTTIPAGKYGLYTIPGVNEWTIILSKDPEQWGAYTYKPTDDVLRVTAKPTTLPMSVETFTIGFDAVREDKATMYLAWDTTLVTVPLNVDTTGRVKAEVTRVAGSPDATPQFYAQAANYYLTHDLDPRKALEWIDLALQATPDSYNYYYLKAKIQAKMGEKGNALNSAEKARVLLNTRPANEIDPDTVAAMDRFIETVR